MSLYEVWCRDLEEPVDFVCDSTLESYDEALIVKQSIDPVRCPVIRCIDDEEV